MWYNINNFVNESIHFLQQKVIKVHHTILQILCKHIFIHR